MCHPCLRTKTDLGKSAKKLHHPVILNPHSLESRCETLSYKLVPATARPPVLHTGRAERQQHASLHQASEFKHSKPGLMVQGRITATQLCSQPRHYRLRIMLESARLVLTKFRAGLEHARSK